MSQSRWNLVYLILFLSVAAVFVAFYALDLRLNLTPSLPMGIWYQAEWASTSSRRGDVVVFCPPDTLLFRKAKANGVLRWGRCVGGYAPLMKRVVAVAGDVVEVDDVVKVNGREIAPSRVIPEVAAVYGRGARKRKLAKGEIFVMGDVDNSFDGRYWPSIVISTSSGIHRIHLSSRSD